MKKEFGLIVDKMISEMSLGQKVSQLRNSARAVKKLGINEYDWWNEGLHGVARAGLATVFPQAIGMAATFDSVTMLEVGKIVSTEARAKYNDAQSHRDYSRYKGLTFWSPNINIYRDPRWGRGQETYGEDPYLTATLGVNYIKGLQGEDENYLKVAACAKHYAVHSGPEAGRHTDDINPNKRDLFDTYLVAFEAAVKLGNVESVMSAYNAVYGEPCSCSHYLLEDILREKWGFKGHVVSDCSAVSNIVYTHHRVSSPIKAAAIAINNGCDLECGTMYSTLTWAVRFKLVDEKVIDKSLRRLLMTRARLGMFDKDCPYDNIPMSEAASKEHEEYAVEVARRSVVMLKNDGVLPLNKQSKIGVFGPNSKSTRMLLGNYEGTPSGFVTLYDGIEKAVGKNNISYAEGCHIVSSKGYENKINTAISAAKECDIIVLCLGLDASLEGEEGDADSFDENGNKYRGDRGTLELPRTQTRLIEAMTKLGKPIIILNCSGGAVTFGGLEDKVSAIMQCWYPGAMGGRAVADILFGNVSPSGKLPVTFYSSDKDLPDFSDYSMANRTYRYYSGNPLYPFGYGLSYAKMEYSNLELKEGQGDDVGEISVKVTNCSDMKASEVMQMYVSVDGGKTVVPKYSLRRTVRIELAPKESKVMRMNLSQADIEYVDDNGDRVAANGEIKIYVGGCSPDERNAELGLTMPLMVRISN